jgi:hypothetical protein
MTNDARLCVLNRTLESLLRYTGPVAAMGALEEGVDTDLWEMLEGFERALEKRIEEVEEAV